MWFAIGIIIALLVGLAAGIALLWWASRYAGPMF